MNDNAPAETSQTNAEMATRYTGVLAGLSLPMLLSSIGTSIANVGLPGIGQALDASFQEVQWVVLAYLLGVSTLIVSVGRLGDIAGRRRLLLGGIGLFLLASLLCAGAQALWVLVCARALQGMGAAAMMALSMALVAEAVPRAHTGRAMGLLGTMSAVGTALGPSLGGVLLRAFGWRALFLAGVPLGMVAALLVMRFLSADKPAQREDRASFDWLGTLLLAGSLAAYASAATLGRGHFSSLNAGLLAVSVLGLGAFIQVQLKAAAPLVPVRLVRTAGMPGGLLLNAMVSAVVMSTLVVGPYYLAQGLGLDPARVGGVMSVGPIVVALLGVPAGRMIDGIGARTASLIGLMLMTSGAAMLAAMPATLGVAGYLAPVVVLTAGYAIFQTANNAAVMAAARAEERGLTSGLLNLARNLGLITGASVLGAVFAFATGNNEVGSATPDAVASGMRGTFSVAAILLLLALLIAAAPVRAQTRNGLAAEASVRG